MEQLRISNVSHRFNPGDKPEVWTWRHPTTYAAAAIRLGEVIRP